MTIENLRKANKLYDELIKVNSDIGKLKAILVRHFSRAVLQCEHLSCTSVSTGHDFVEKVYVPIDEDDMEIIEPIVKKRVKELEHKKKEIEKELESL